VQSDRLKVQELLPDFLMDIFHVIIGYSRPTDSPSRYTLSREKHVQVDGKFADAVLGEFREGQEGFVIEWESYLAEKKAEVDRLSRQLADAEAELNDRVYHLFDLTADEIMLLQREVEHRRQPVTKH
jgi:hypothetical protein